MDRRAFLRLIEQSAAAVATSNLLEALPLFPAAQTNTAKTHISTKGRPQVALTMDDPNANFENQMPWREANKRILGALKARNLTAALFVCGKRVDKPDAQGLVVEWDNSGHLICNHSYSHLMFTDPAVSYEEFAADFLRDEPIIARYGQRTRMFRYPFLKEGDKLKRVTTSEASKQHEYTVGHVTIDRRAGT